MGEVRERGVGGEKGNEVLYNWVFSRGVYISRILQMSSNS